MSSFATVGGGCFWCVEAAFKEADGVISVTSGYAGGKPADPTYREVCSGQTGHAEVVRIEFDADKLSYSELLELFFSIHDPTQHNRQGPDVGSQYRSIVLAESATQTEVAQEYIETLQTEYDEAIVTEIEPLTEFYPAEAHHQDYFEKNPTDAYCQAHAQPKIEKVRERYPTA